MAFDYKVLLLGRVNVGKSTLFNRLTRSRRMITTATPGATRDRVYGWCEMSACPFQIIDCAGYEGETGLFQPFDSPLVWQQTHRAMEEAHLILLVMDGLHGFHLQDQELFLKLKKQPTPTLYVVSKVDGPSQENSLLADFYNKLCGAEKIYGVSGTTAHGLQTLVEVISQTLENLDTQKKPKRSAKTADEKKQGVAIIGRPNSGKSSLLNRLVSAQRSCVSEIAGTTRDVVDVTTRYHQHNYTLYDTAGVRRRVKVKGFLEKTSVTLTLQTIRRAQVTLLVVDAMEGFTSQDAKLVHLVLEEGKPLIIVINKKDLIPEKTSNTLRQYEKNLRARHLANLKFVPIRFISALQNERVHNLYSTISMVAEMSQKRIPTAAVNTALQEITQHKPPPALGTSTKRIKFYYITQISVAPPTFLIKSNHPQRLNASYRTYLKTNLQKKLKLSHVPIRVIFRSKDSEGTRSTEHS